MPHAAPAHKSLPTGPAFIRKSLTRSSPSWRPGACHGSSPGDGGGESAARPAEERRDRSAYTGINILILWGAVIERGFTGQNWLTFRQALRLDAHVRKGERGTTVVYADRFIPYDERAAPQKPATKPEAIPFLKRFTVFNADQCEGLPAEIGRRRRRRSKTT